MDVDGDGDARSRRRRRSRTSASRSAASTGRSSSPSSRTSAPACRTSRAARSSRSPGWARLPRRSSALSLARPRRRRSRTCPAVSFNENMPLRNLPPLVDTVPGAAAIQEVIERTEWASQAGNPVAYAPHLRADPLAGVPAKSIILQFARGDQTVPNPTTSAIIRAGGLAGPDDALPERPRVRRRTRVPEEPAHVPDEHRRARAGRRSCGGARGAGCRSRCSSPRAARSSIDPDGAGRALRDADGRRTAGGSGLHPVSRSRYALAACASCWSCSKPGLVTVCY